MGIFDELGRRVTNAGQKTVQKTKEFSESARINALIGDEEKKIKNACCEIGKIYASLHKNDYEPEVASWMEIVNEAEQKIEDYKRQIEAIKAVKRCSCGAELVEGMAFCAACGSPVQKQEPITAEEMKCVHCGNPIKKDANFCIHCGMPVENVQNIEKPEVSPVEEVVEEQICSVCGAKQSLEAVFCTECGNRMKQDSEEKEPEEAVIPECIPDLAEEVEVEPEPEPASEPEPVSEPEEEQEPVFEEALPRCSNCGEVLLEGVNFCIHCGTPVTVKIKSSEPLPNKCPKCGELIQDGMRFCIYCGTPVEQSVEPEKKICPKCGTELARETLFCTNCGEKLENR